MISQPGTGHATPRELFEQAQQTFLKKDLNAFADMFAEDGIHELPFAPPGVPKHLRGRENIRGYLTAITATPLELNEFRDLTIYDTTDPEIIIIEYEAAGTVVATNLPYTSRYIQILQARNGAILLWRDYWNPLAGAQALGRLPQLFSALTGEDLK
jgi:hypothetical protein